MITTTKAAIDLVECRVFFVTLSDVIIPINDLLCSTGLAHKFGQPRWHNLQFRHKGKSAAVLLGVIVPRSLPSLGDFLEKAVWRHGIVLRVVVWQASENYGTSGAGTGAAST